MPLGSVTSQSSGPAFQPHRLRLALDEMDSASPVDDTSVVRLCPFVPWSDQAVPGAVVTARSPHDSSSSTRADDPNDPWRAIAVPPSVAASVQGVGSDRHGDEHRAEHEARHRRRDDATRHRGASAAEHEAGADRDDGQRPPGERVGHSIRVEDPRGDKERHAARGDEEHSEVQQTASHGHGIHPSRNGRGARTGPGSG